MAEIQTRAQAPANRVVTGIACRLGAVVMMGAMAALVKLAAERGAHTFEIIFFRNLFAFIPLMAWILSTRGLAVLHTRRPLGHLARSTMGVAGMICGFGALGLMPLSEFTAITFAAPLFITALSGPVLGERVGPHRWAAVVVGFLGVLVMVRPDPVHLVGLGPLLALGQAVGTAGALLAVRQIGRTESGPTIVFYFTLAATVVGAIGTPFVWTRPDAELLVILVLTGLTGGVGQLLLTHAFRVASPSIVAPFDYASLLWAGLIGYLIWREVPSLTTLAGAVVVVGSGLYILWRETRNADPGSRP